MNPALFDQEIAKLNAETVRLIDETVKINSRSPYVQMALGCAVTLGIVVVLSMVAQTTAMVLSYDSIFTGY